MDTMVRTLLREADGTYAKEAGISLKDQPAALWKLLVLTNLLSAPVTSNVSVNAARELFKAGGGTSRGMARMTWQERVDALTRGHYRRYDEGTSTRLGDMAELVQEKYGGDLRRLAAEANHDVGRTAKLLKEFPGIGPTGVDIFCREAQAIWPWLRPYVDTLATKGARRLGLTTDPKRLAAKVPSKDLARFAADLVRAAHSKELVGVVKN